MLIIVFSKICSGFVICILLLSGCAFSVFQKEVNYSYSGPVNTNVSTNSTNTLTVDNFDDLRDVTTPRIIFHMYNANGHMTTGGWEAEKPIAEIIKNGVMEGLQLSNLKLMPEGDFILTGKVLEFTRSSKVDSSLHHTFTCKLAVKFKMVSSTIKKIIWNDTFYGQGTASKVTHEGAHAIECFTTALDSLVEQLITDEYFLQFFVINAYGENLKTSQEHVDSVREIAEIIERYKEKTGNYPFKEHWDNVEEGYAAVPISAHLTIRDLPEDFKYPPIGVSGLVISAKALEDYLSKGLKERIVLPKDDRKIKSPIGNWPFYYEFMYDGKNYFVSCYLQEELPNTRKLDKNWYKYEVGSIAVPQRNIIRYRDLSK